VSRSVPLSYLKRAAPFAPRTRCVMLGNKLQQMARENLRRKSYTHSFVPDKILYAQRKYFTT